MSLTNARGGEWTGTYTPSALGSVTFHASITVSGVTDSQDAVVSVVENYACSPTWERTSTCRSISGTPTKVANFSFTVQASDRTSTGSKAFTLKINKK